MKVANRDYSGKTVFVGMDVHKKFYVIEASCDGEIVKKWTTPAEPTSLAEQLTRYFPGAKVKSVYEAGFCGFTLHRRLLAAGIENIVVNPASIEVSSNNRVKTDKRDAHKLNEQLTVGRLRGIYVPAEAEEERRSLTRGREQVVRRRKAIGNQLKMKLHYLGIPLPDGLKMSERFLRWVEGLELAQAHQFVLSELIDAWRQEAKRLRRFDAELKKQAEEDPLETIYRSAPGIGATSSRTLSNELGDMSRFHNERQLFAASGLTPGEHSSGEHVRKGHISRQGAARLRGLLTEVAWRAIGEDRSLKAVYLRIARTRDSKRAIVAVARKILGRLRHCLRHGVPWKDLGDVAAVPA